MLGLLRTLTAALSLIFLGWAFCDPLLGSLAALAVYVCVLVYPSFAFFLLLLVLFLSLIASAFLGGCFRFGAPTIFSAFCPYSSLLLSCRAARSLRGAACGSSPRSGALIFSRFRGCSCATAGRVRGCVTYFRVPHLGPRAQSERGD